MKTNHTSVKTNLPVPPSEEISNFLYEDFDAVKKFMNVEMEKKRLKL